MNDRVTIQCEEESEWKRKVQELSPDAGQISLMSFPLEQISDMAHLARIHGFHWYFDKDTLIMSRRA